MSSTSMRSPPCFILCLCCQSDFYRVEQQEVFSSYLREVQPFKVVGAVADAVVVFSSIVFAAATAAAAAATGRRRRVMMVRVVRLDGDRSWRAVGMSINGRFGWDQRAR